MTQPQPEEENHQGRMGRVQRRSALRQVWRKKIVIHEEYAPPEPPTMPSSESQDDWENGESCSEDLKTPNALPREFKDQRRLADGGHPNHCQSAADIQIHLRHLLHQKELRQNPAWGGAPPFIQLSILLMFILYSNNKKMHNHKNPNKDFVFIYLCLVC